MRPVAFAAVVTLALCGRASATDFAPKTDNRIVARDLGSGKLLWAYRTVRLSDAHSDGAR